MKRYRPGLVVLSLLVASCGSDQQDVATAPPVAARAAVADAASMHVDGAETFNHWCEPCHAVGAGHPGTFRLAERLGADRSVLLDRTDLNADYIKVVVRNGFQMMPPFRATEIPDAELEALAAYVATPGPRPGSGTGTTP